MMSVDNRRLIEFNRAIIDYRANYRQLASSTTHRRSICSSAVHIYRRYLSRTSGRCHVHMRPTTVDDVRRSITVALASRTANEPTIELFDQCQRDVAAYLSGGSAITNCCCSCRCASTPCWSSSSSSPNSGTDRKSIVPPIPVASMPRSTERIDLDENDQFAGSLSSSTIDEEDDGASSSSDSAFCSASSNYIKLSPTSDHHQSIEGRRTYVDELCARLEIFTSFVSQLQMTDKGGRLEDSGHDDDDDHIDNYIRENICDDEHDRYLPCTTASIKIGYCIEEEGNDGHYRPPYVKQILSTDALTFGEFKRHFSLRHDNNVQFFFKNESIDPQTRYELLLIGDDRTVLPIFDGRIMAVVKSK